MRSVYKVFLTAPSWASVRTKGACLAFSSERALLPQVMGMWPAAAESPAWRCGPCPGWPEGVTTHSITMSQSTGQEMGRFHQTPTSQSTRAFRSCLTPGELFTPGLTRTGTPCTPTEHALEPWRSTHSILLYTLPLFSASSWSKAQGWEESEEPLPLGPLSHSVRSQQALENSEKCVTPKSTYTLAPNYEKHLFN